MSQGRATHLWVRRATGPREGWAALAQSPPGWSCPRPGLPGGRHRLRAHSGVGAAFRARSKTPDTEARLPPRLVKKPEANLEPIFIVLVASPLDSSSHACCVIYTYTHMYTHCPHLQQTTPTVLETTGGNGAGCQFHRRRSATGESRVTEFTAQKPPEECDQARCHSLQAAPRAHALSQDRQGSPGRTPSRC